MEKICSIICSIFGTIQEQCLRQHKPFHILYVQMILCGVKAKVLVGHFYNQVPFQASELRRLFSFARTIQGKKSQQFLQFFFLLFLSFRGFQKPHFGF